MATPTDVVPPHKSTINRRLVLGSLIGAAIPASAHAAPSLQTKPQITTASDLVAAIGASTIAETLGVEDEEVELWALGVEPIPTGWHYRLHLMATDRGYDVCPRLFVGDKFPRASIPHPTTA
jgi:hypothetical protein